MWKESIYIEKIKYLEWSKKKLETVYILNESSKLKNNSFEKTVIVFNCMEKRSLISVKSENLLSLLNQ